MVPFWGQARFARVRKAEPFRNSVRHIADHTSCKSHISGYLLVLGGVQGAADADEVSGLLESTIELPEADKSTFFAPLDLGWHAELINSTEPVQV